MGGDSSLVYRLYRVKSARLQPDRVGRVEGGGSSTVRIIFRTHQIHNVTVTSTTGRLENVLANYLTI